LTPLHSFFLVSIWSRVRTAIAAAVNTLRNGPEQRLCGDVLAPLCDESWTVDGEVARVPGLSRNVDGQFHLGMDAAENQIRAASGKAICTVSPGSCAPESKSSLSSKTRMLWDPLMQGLRTDVSFTLFLAEPESYDGGELVIERIRRGRGETRRRKSRPYPSTALRQVAAVTRGTRLAAVGWARSYIRDSAQRELLFDLDTARRQLFEREGKSAQYDLVSKSLANLLRMWVDD
jgi:hypothetical protein